MLQDATRRWRSSKATKQTRTHRCTETFKCCKILLEDEGDETRHHRARLLKYYPRPPCAPSFVKSRIFRPLQTHFLLFQQIFFVLVCIHSGTPRVPPRVLASGPKPCGGNKVLVNQKRGKWVQWIIKQITDLLTTDKSRYFVQPCPVIVNCPLTYRLDYISNG